MPGYVPVGYNTGASSGGPSIIFRPGAASVGNIINNAADVATAIALVHGAANVYIDDSFAPPTIPSGVTWDFHGFGSIFGRTTFPTLEVEDGGQILHLLSLVNVNILCDCQTLPTFDYGTEYTVENGPSLLVNFSSITLKSTCTIAPFALAAGDFTITGFNEVEFLNSAAPTVPFVALTGAASFTLFTIECFQGSVPPTMVSGGAGTSFEYAADVTGFPAPVWSLFTGTLYPPAFVGQAPPVYLTNANSGATLPGAPVALVFIDSSAGQPTFNLPAGSLLQDGWTVVMVDNGPGFNLGTGGSWAINTPVINTTDGSTIQGTTDRTAEGASTLLPAMNGGYHSVMWSAAGNMWFVSYSSLSIALSGATAGRPTTQTVGLEFFDTTLGFPVWWNGTTWVNSAGVPS
jgi:hypothetical protein